jgi:hypothetical protein
MLFTLTEMVFIGTKSASRQLAATFGALTLKSPICCSPMYRHATYHPGHVGFGPQVDRTDGCTRD